MFSNTAYEAVYQYLGLQLHSKFIELITSQKVFAAVIIMTFGYLFFTTSAHFFSRYVPGALVKRRSVPLSKFVQIVACLFLGMSLLRVGSNTSVKQLNGMSWDANPYVKIQIANVQPEYRVSLIFDIISRTAEELSGLITQMIDKVFRTSNSQIEAPDFFFKAIMLAGISTIEDPELKKAIRFYTEECFDKFIPLIKDQEQFRNLNTIFGDDSLVEKKMSEIIIDGSTAPPVTCREVKRDVRERLFKYAYYHQNPIVEETDRYASEKYIDKVKWTNLNISSYLTNHYLDEHESYFGIQKGSQLPTTSGRVFQYINRFFSWDTLLSVFGQRELHGASLAASRAQEFSENLARAPHVAGFIKMFAIMIFPWLVFFVVAGYWRVLYYWFLIYFSVLLWTPIWTLLYHIMVSLSMSADTMAAFGQLSDGISLYSASLITSRMYYFFAVYSWLQLLIGTVFTGGLIYFIKPMLSDTDRDTAPEFVDGVKNTAVTGSKVAGVF